VLEGADVLMLHAGMFFGEISTLLDEPVPADVVARSPLRCAVVERDKLMPFLMANPSVAVRLLQAEARRVADTYRWRA
jgi:CRP-like cAMP-binding protein